MAQYVHNRRPQYKGTMGFEMERPSASYVIDVSQVDLHLVEKLQLS